jgi:hypothetical protein
MHVFYQIKVRYFKPLVYKEKRTLSRLRHDKAFDLLSYPKRINPNGVRFIS